MESNPRPRLLFIARSSSVAELREILREQATEAIFSPTKKRNPTPPGYRRFSLKELFRLWRSIRSGKYDLVISYATAEPLFPPHTFFLKRWFKAAKKFLFEFETLGPVCLPWLLRSSSVPLVVYEWEDSTVIFRHNWPLLARSRYFFKINCPPNLYKAFLFQDRKNGDVFNIVRQKKYREWVKKIRPISLGGPDSDALKTLRHSEKKVDVFFAGAINYSWVREQGLAQLKSLEKEGYLIDFPQERLSRPDFLRRCSEAWLVWAPEGAEWDTHRCYEAALAWSVPLLNYPSTQRYQPLLDRIHAFYYGVEGDHLAQVIREALQDKERLQTMAVAAEAHVRRYHLHRHLAQKMIHAGLGGEEKKSAPA